MASGRQELAVLIGDTWTLYPEHMRKALGEIQPKTVIAEVLIRERKESAPKHVAFYSKIFVDFKALKEFNAYSTTTRPIKFIQAKDAGSYPCMKSRSLAKITAVPDIPNRKKYTAEAETMAVPKKDSDCYHILTRMNKVWLQYSPLVEKLLQDSYVQGYAIVEFVIFIDNGENHQKYYTKYQVNFGELLQVNAHTEKTRKIRFVKKAASDANTKELELAPGRLATDHNAIKTLGNEKQEQSPAAVSHVDSQLDELNPGSDSPCSMDLDEDEKRVKKVLVMSGAERRLYSARSEDMPRRRLCCF